MTFLEFLDQFPTEKSVIDYFITIRYKSQVKCNHCNSDRVSHRADQPRLFQCNNCNNSFSIFKGTILKTVIQL